ncbi:type IV secretory system conjugative DNA transfer family protein [Hyphomicrobium zavarzinii]|uniref:type IV secretory system conjugative DNA transfer family protein n=1 Tax=Hyphomicrobium zavarzinii TaxID=48292 RepID=UPI000367F603|nr:type IV secretory system conjugative DNA transfer family protein [Hyphomicrobium zavarzinii]
MTGRFSSPTARPITSPHPLRNPGDYTQSSFVPALDALLGDPAAELSVPVTDLTGMADRKQFARFINDHVNKDAPSKIAYAAGAVMNILTLNPAAQAAHTAKHLNDTWKHTSKVKELYRTVDQFTAARPVLSLTDKERAFLRSNADFTAQHQMTPDQWGEFLATLIWNDGKCRLDPAPSIAGLAATHIAHDVVRTFLQHWMDKHEVFLASTAADIAKRAQNLPASKGGVPNAVLHQALDTGAKWMDLNALRSSRYYSVTEKPEALLLGYEPQSGAPVCFAGAESLITIGGPGSGKSQCQVIPNLLRYKGSAIVLDVKGELWDATAGYRAKNYGPVYRFAPTDRSLTTNRYNPFDFISQDPSTAADQATVLTYQVVVDDPNLKEPYWENRGRDLMWAFAMMVAVKAPPDKRTMKGLAELMSVPFSEDPDSDIQQLLESMIRMAKRTGIFDLEAAANAIRAGIKAGGTRLEGVLDTGRRYLSVFTRSPTIEQTISTSDWRPEHFRTRPGTTLYICVPPAELKAYAPIIRIMLIQHTRILMRKQAAQGELPITFFLDEMPQLGNFESILELQDVGRGSGLRLWMFAQYIAQLEAAFGNKYQGVVDACRSRSFLQPDMQLVKLIQPGLGTTRNPFTGETKKLAEDHDLVGRLYDDKVILTTRGDHPMALDKRYAWQTDKAKMLPPPHPHSCASHALARGHAGKPVHPVAPRRP